jgi:hypothetical protein
VRCVLISLYLGPGKVGTHASEKVVHRVARKIRVSACKVVQDEQLAADLCCATCGRTNLVAARPSLDGGDALLRSVARASASAHVNVYEIIQRAQDEIEEFNVVADPVGKESRG